MAVTMVRSIHRPSDNDGVGAVMTAAVVVECNIPMAAVMETMSFTVDNHAVIVPVMVSVMSMSLDYDRVGRGHGRYEKAQCQSTKHDGFHLRSSSN
ncbi:msr8065 [Mesorhizobium japonicum MAFF 303099]|uniref:Msr8065 protein n=2 Tax=Mesorhizobium japonicum TaxID=2066070 RepID=Q984C2_RHILO|nr:msr8065 [Mesorhizobium japonicum MAFF 303099]